MWRNSRSKPLVLLAGLTLVSGCNTVSDLDEVVLEMSDAGGDVPVRADIGADTSCAAPAVYYRDADGDGFGTTEGATQACELPTGYVTNFLDCDDTDPNRNPDAEEICDTVDNNCDGRTDEDLATIWYRDADRDGYGRNEDTKVSCTQPVGYVLEGGDCGDEDPLFHPGAPEGDCTDPVDYNCDGSTGYADVDGDGFAACVECDDTRADVNPGADETCDEVDNDCDGDIDEPDATDAKTYHRDSDGDGFGASGSGTRSCVKPAGTVLDQRDCDDDDPQINPDAAEVCDDGHDNECDGDTDGEDEDCQTEPELSCPGDLTIDLFGDAELTVSVVSATSSSVEWTLAARPPGSRVSLESDGTSAVLAPDQRGAYTVEVTASNAYGADSCTVAITYDGPRDCGDGFDTDLDGEIDEDIDSCAAAPVADCGGALDIEVDSDFEMGVTATGEIERVEWLVTSWPQGFEFAERPSMDGGLAQAPLVGQYDVLVIFTAIDGEQGACVKTIQASTSAKLRAELYWNPDEPASTNRSDLDLHLLHPSGPGWFDDAYDCGPSNCLADNPPLDWGAPDVTADNPRLVRDARHGPGAEAIVIAEPEANTVYRVGVFSWTDRGQGPDETTVKIYCEGVLAATFGPATLRGPTDGEGNNDFWRVADVGFGDLTQPCVVTPLLVDGALNITDRDDAEANP